MIEKIDCPICDSLGELLADYQSPVAIEPHYYRCPACRGTHEISAEYVKRTLEEWEEANEFDDEYQ